MESLEKQFEHALASIPFGTSGKNILQAEVVHSCVVNEDFAKFTLILPTDSPLRQTLPKLIEEKITALEPIKRVAVEISAEVPTEQEPAEAKRPAQQPKRTSYFQNYQAVIAVASGKGGVGKSTVSVNLALALAKLGHKVALFDADIYGPSIPIMMGLRGQKPPIKGGRLQPIQRYGLDTMSIGFLVEEDSSMVWRGPMVHSALEQLMRDTEWPGGDFVVLDLPPGTGDAQLTLSQSCEIAGAVVVSTPQDVALLDAIKAVNMFTKVDIDILGIVENMSTFICPHCQAETPIFNQHGAQRVSENLEVPFLGNIPIELAIRQGGDVGMPVMSQEGNSPYQEAFLKIAKNVINALE